MADFLAGGPQAFATGCLAALNQAAVRGALLHAWQAVDWVDVREQPKAEDLANAGNRVQPRQGMGIVVLGGFHEKEFEVLE